jgi:hypothetical protein
MEHNMKPGGSKKTQNDALNAKSPEQVTQQQHAKQAKHTPIVQEATQPEMAKPHKTNLNVLHARKMGDAAIMQHGTGNALHLLKRKPDCERRSLPFLPSRSREVDLGKIRK